MSALPEFVAPAGTPDWFLQAIAQPKTSHFATTPDGCRIHYVCWNEREREKPGLLFVHGYRAHAHVWDFIAPYFTENYRVAALDLSGMGDSDRRSDYAYRVFGEDIRAVIEDAGLAPATLVAHSFGGSRAVQFAATYPDLLQRLVIVDSMIPLAAIDQIREIPRVGRAAPYPDYATIVSRYRLLPEQPAPAWAVAYMAHHSVREIEGGWTWKFDLDLPAGRVEFATEKFLPQLKMPTDQIVGAKSAIVDGPRVGLIARAIGQGRRPIYIPEAHHHVMLDQPLAFIAALRALLT